MNRVYQVSPAWPIAVFVSDSFCGVLSEAGWHSSECDAVLGGASGSLQGARDYAVDSAGSLFRLESGVQGSTKVLGIAVGGIAVNELMPTDVKVPAQEFAERVLKSLHRDHEQALAEQYALLVAHLPEHTIIPESLEFFSHRTSAGN